MICLGIPLLLLQAGCFGGSAALPARSEARQQAETALSRAIRAEHRGDGLEAERLLTRSLTISSSIEDNPARAMALINLARLYRLRPDLPKAESSIDQAIAVTETDPGYAAEAAYEKALVELALDRPLKALEWARKSIAAERENALGSRLNLAARIQIVCGSWRDAQGLAEKALSENRAAGQAEEEANSLRILGMIAGHEQDYERGAQLLQEALQIDKRIGKAGKIAADLGGLAETARSAGRLRESAAYLERAYEVNRAGSRLRQAKDNLELLAVVYTSLGEEQQAARAREAAGKLVIPDAIQQPVSSSATTKPSSSP